MLKHIIYHEWISIKRTRLFRSLLILILFLAGISSFISNSQLKKHVHEQNELRAKAELEWKQLGAYNPHNAAHVGTYAFLPVGFLNSLDLGVLNEVGSSIRLEGHVQNDLIDPLNLYNSSIAAFGEFRPVLLLQLVIPLLLMFLSFSSISWEKERGLLKQLRLITPSWSNYLLSKVFFYWSLGVALLLIVLMVTQLSLGLSEVYVFEIRFWFFVLVYALFYLIVVSISVFLSFRLKHTVSVLILLLGIWVLWVLYLPFLSNSVATSLTSLPTRYEFVSAMKNDRSKGIDGHNPVQQRENRLLDSILTVYSVKTTEELPINFDGLVMQADEDYGNKVWDKHFGALHQKRLAQKETARWFDLVNPYAVVKRLSSGLAATDYVHYAHFEQQAELFRRGFIKELNDKHAYGGSKTGDWSWKADSTFFATMKLFYYEVPEYSHMKQHYNWEFLMLAIFSCLSIGILFLPVLEEDFL